MRIAVLLCGHTRTWNESIKNNLKNFIGDYDTDIFISTYNTDNSSEIDGVELSHNQIIKMFSGLNIKGIDIDSDDAINTSIVKNYHQHYSWKMWRKVWKANEMRKQYEKDNNIKYDYIVRTRPDNYIMEKINFNELNIENKIIIGFGATLGFPDDMFAVGTPVVMDDYCDINKTNRPDCKTHAVAKFTIDKYPVAKFVQIGVVRKQIIENEFFKRIEKLENYFLHYYPKASYGF